MIDLNNQPGWSAGEREFLEIAIVAYQLEAWNEGSMTSDEVSIIARYLYGWSTSLAASVEAVEMDWAVELRLLTTHIRTFEHIRAVLDLAAERGRKLL